MVRTHVSTILGITLIAAAGAAVQLGQPVQVDDPLYLGVAKRILETPFSPFSGSPPWSDGTWFDENANPPLWSYLLAATAALFGWNETSFQILQSLAFLALTAGVFRLATRISARPLFWTAAVCCSPFLLPCRNLMVDTAMMAFWVWALECQLNSCDTGRVKTSLAAGILAGFAMLTKYTGGLLLPLFVFSAWRSRRWSSLIALVPAVLLFGLWCLQNQVCYGRLHLPASMAPRDGVGNATLEDRSLVLTRVVGAVVWWTPVWLLAAVGHCRGWSKILPLMVLPLAWWFGGASWGRVLDCHREAQSHVTDWFLWHAAVFAGNGAAALSLGVCLSVLALRVRTDGNATTAVVAWAVLAFAFNLFAVSPIAFGAVRHVAVGLPALMLAVAGPIDRWIGGSFWRRSSVVAVFVANAALAGLQAHGDRCIASVAPLTAKQFVGDPAAGKTRWFVGDPAMRYYCESAGGKLWRRDWNELAVGDRLVMSFRRATALLDDAEMQNRLTRTASFDVRNWNPVRTQGEFINFYACNRFGVSWVLEQPDEKTEKTRSFLVDQIFVLMRIR